MQSPNRARYIMIGGFLGAGKTTAIGKFAQWLSEKGRKVGLITNDQAGGLVDTRVLRSQGFATEEIAGGCFCCRFNSLVDAAGKLTQSTKPDTFIAEPVGSCTDLVATVSYPLRRLYGADYTIAPLSVLVDPVRARRVLGLEQGGNFSSKVVYIFRKQLEEADIIAISKCELLDEAALRELSGALAREFPKAEVLAISSRTGAGLETWFEKIFSGEQQVRKTMDVDYDVYADGEALLGWFNGTVELRSENDFDPNVFLKSLATDMQQRLGAQHAEIAHLKMTLSPDAALNGEIASINLVRNDYVPESSMELDDEIQAAQLIINLRAETSPDALEKIVRESLQAVTPRFTALQAKLVHEEHFRPGRPTPTHRDQ